ncbi:hypothetical protein P7M11_02785 [Bisgaard Taxon 10/6]|uniref:hypothetical protein n=1 Tax=Exercitatus varius TaxID=67857 RepID=UPI00294B83CA|nr:hypothetical protein [Exercitatus varius]MDG2953653.1 hypothetical protein [Exercitatus varius]
MLFILLFIFSLIFIFAIRQKPRLLHFGTFRFAKTICHNQQRFYLEEVAFENRQQAIHGYFQLAPALQNYGKVQETEYDFFDFYSVVLRFDDCTMKLVRRLDNVRLIKSEQPMSIAEFEQQIADIAYREV